MSFATKYNRGARFDIDTTNFTYKSLQDLKDEKDPEKVFTIRGFYINKRSKYGEAPVAIIDGVFVNLPKHLTDDVKDMLLDRDILEAINDGKCGFTIREYDDSTYKRHCYTVEWKDL